jgi:hypothetical protein
MTGTYTYYSTHGVTCLIQRQSLSKLYLSEAGEPMAVGYWADYHQRDMRYEQLHGLAVSDYDRLKPDLVVYQLADGTLLAAPKALLEEGVTDTTAHKGNCYIHQVEYLTVLAKLPKKLP